MTENFDAKMLVVDASTHRRLKAFAAYTGKTMILATIEAINDYLDRQSSPDFRHVAADSDHIAQPNEA